MNHQNIRTATADVHFPSMARHFLAWSVLALSLATIGRADDFRTETVRFDKATSGTTIEDSLKGYDTVQYLFGAGEGQTMKVDMTTDNRSAYFNIFEPGETPGHDAALFIGSTAGLSFEGRLPADGDYMIQVYLMRNAARRDEVANYTLEIGIDDGETEEGDAEASARAARDAAYEAYVRELAQEGQPKVVTYDELRAALRGHQVVVLGGYSGLDYEHPEVLREQIAALVKEKGDRAAYVIGATDGGIGRAYDWIPEIASELGVSDVQTAGIVSRNAAEWGVAPQDYVVFVDTGVDDWEVEVDGRSLMVSIAKDTGGEMIYFQGGAVSKAEIGEALERGVPVTVYTGDRVAPSAAKLAKKGTTAKKADGTAAFVEGPPPGLKVVTVER